MCIQITSFDQPISVQHVIVSSQSTFFLVNLNLTGYTQEERGSYSTILHGTPSSVALQSACGYYGHPSSVECRIVAAAEAYSEFAEVH